MSAAKKEQMEQNTTSPILLLEASFTLSKILVVVVLAVTAVFSLLAGCTWKAVVLRAGSVTLVLGLILFGINWLISDGTLDVIFKQVASVRKKKEQSSPNEWRV